MKRTADRKNRPQPRRGFSLIELLAVIIVIGILVSLLFPAINAVRRNAQFLQVSAEINQLEQAIASFKSLYGVDPPSSLTIPTSDTGWTAADRAKVRGIWPDFDFASCGGNRVSDGSIGYPSTPKNLGGAECLVFFLSGVDGDPTDTDFSPSGFSKNPSTPWAAVAAINATPPLNTTPPFSENRDITGFSFDPGRLVDVDGDGFREFLDPLPGQTSPYLFFSSQGKSYHRQNDPGAADDFDTFGTPADSAGRDMLRIYFQGDNKTPQRANSYQIISAGADRLYGDGGPYSKSEDVDVPARAEEQDNITNFSNGTLKK